MEKLSFWMLLLFFLVGCDTVYILIFEKVENFTLQSKCGNVKMYGSSLGGIQPRIHFVFDSEYKINLDSLKIITANNYILKTFHFRLNGEIIINETIIIVKKQDILTVCFDYSDTKCFILPSNFIECNGELIIKNIIEIEVKVK
jgi:predicted RNA-binding protein